MVKPATPSATQTWDLTQLLDTGKIKVVGEPKVSQPSVGSVEAVNGSIVTKGTGGTANAQFAVLSTTDIAAALSSWSTAVTGQFDASGNFSFTIPVDAQSPRRFFVIKTLP
jgi:hypothetical protein